jgi:carbon storage regulator
MLVLARRSGESILIGDDIEITIVEVQGDNVKVGINAPKKIPIMRKELLEVAKAANEQAASPDVDLTSLESIVNNK